MIKIIQKNGPIIAFGKIGPAYYQDHPFMKSQIEGEHIYGWKDETKRREELKYDNVIVIGAKSRGKRDFVYFIQSQLAHPNADDGSYRRYSPSSIDQKIYGISYKIFNEYVEHLHLPINKEETSPNLLSAMKGIETALRSVANERLPFSEEELLEMLKLRGLLTNAQSLSGDKQVTSSVQ